MPGEFADSVGTQIKQTAFRMLGKFIHKIVWFVPEMSHYYLIKRKESKLTIKLHCTVKSVQILTLKALLLV